MKLDTGNVKSAEHVEPGGEVVKRVYGGFRREKTQQAGLVIELDDEYVFVPDWLLKLAGYSWRRKK